MKLHELKPAKGSVKTGKRVGRGQGGGGTTAGRGHKGSHSRSGYSKKIGFEGGQMPLQRRIPKFGFKNNNKVYFKCVNLDTLSLLAEKTGKSVFDINFFVEHGIMGQKDKVKILGRGELKNALEVVAHSFSEKAAGAIEKQGGKAVRV